MFGGKVVLALWAFAMILVGGALTALHLTALPAQTALPSPAAAGWSIVHVVSPGCGCSRRVMEHLIERGARPQWHERVVLVKPSAALTASLQSAGYHVEDASDETLERVYGLTAVPVLIIERPDGTVAYSGGYAARATLPAQDLELIDQAQRTAAAIVPYPVFGCAMSRALQAAVDPLGLKYGGGAR